MQALSRPGPQSRLGLAPVAPQNEHTHHGIPSAWSSMTVSPEALLRALAEIINKRALLDPDQVPRLVKLALQAGVHDSESLKQWVSSTPKITNELRSELLGVLRTPRQRCFGPFTIVGHLADGGMGDVWLAMDDEGALAVVKTLLPDLHNDDEFVHRFRREAQITSGFTSPFLVRCLGSGTSTELDSSLFIILEYVSGGDLHNLICARERIGELEALRIGRQVALALDEADKLHLVHRDIKPENILITSKGDAKLVDFGLARTTKADRTVLTLAGSTLGTPDYMSPEQIYGDADLDIRSDLYALGCVLFFCLAGHPPYEGDSIDIMKNHLSGNIPNIRSYNSAVSKQTRAIIERCMAKKRDDRFSTGFEMAEACGAAMERKGTQRFDTTMRGIKLSDMLPKPQFSSDSIIELGEAIPPPVIPPMPQAPYHWLLLQDQRSGLAIHLIAKTSILIGKLRASPVDVCLRYYPKEQYAELNNRVSRQHCELRRHESGSGFVITDCGSTNGLLIGGTRIPAHTPWPLPEQGALRVQIPKSLTFSLRGLGGIQPHSLLISRPDNHPQVSYVLAQGEISIGGEDCELRIHDGNSEDDALLLRPGAAGWEWRKRGEDANQWRLVNEDSVLKTASLNFSCRWGNHDDFA
ncbi:MAG: FHA domain-containing protein [Planctomycetota bacterium]|nr:MAG: FHA domain-containing protein [Planctomycetota bacterium]